MKKWTLAEKMLFLSETFFDSVDRQFLRENESQESYETSNIVINNSSDLLPSVSVSVSLPPSSLESDFEPFLTSTPVSPSTVFSPVLSPSGSCYEFLPGPRNLPRTVNYSDEVSFANIRSSPPVC